MNRFVVDAGGPRDRRSIKLATKQGRWIRNEQPLERPPEALHSSAELFKRERPGAKLRSLTATYNCVGMVFASRRTWIEPDELALIFRDDGYRRLSEAAQAEPGDLVVYKVTPESEEVAHIGVVLERAADFRRGTCSLKILSKWGKGGEYIHDEADVPGWLGRPTEYWTERKEKP